MADDLDQLIAGINSRRLLIGEHLAVLHRDWLAAYGKGLGPNQQKRAWACFLAEQQLPNPSNQSPDYITTPIAERLIQRFKDHLLAQRLGANGQEGD